MPRSTQPGATSAPRPVDDSERELRRAGLGQMGRTGVQPAGPLLALQRTVGNSTLLRLLADERATPERVQRKGGLEDDYDEYEEEDEELDDEAAEYLYQEKPAPTVWDFAPQKLHEEAFKEEMYDKVFTPQQLGSRRQELKNVEGSRPTKRRDVRASAQVGANVLAYGHLGDKGSSRRFNRQGELDRERELAHLSGSATTQAQAALVNGTVLALGELGTRRTRVTSATRRGTALTRIATGDLALPGDVGTLASLAGQLNGMIGSCQQLQAQLNQGALDVGARVNGKRLVERATDLVAEVDATVPPIEGNFTILEAQHHAVLTAATTYPNLNLTVATMGAPNGPNVFGAVPLAALNTKAAGARVVGWAPTVWPGTRFPRPHGVPNQVLLPQIEIVVNNIDPLVDPTGTLTLTVGPEIVVDWLYPHPAHGLAFQELRSRANTVLDTQNRTFQMFNPAVVASGHNWKVASNNYAFQLILNGPKNMIITYYTT
jgi:hypothetical protein